ncbi:MAG: sulfatase-like hydrolase/transferase [Sedimentisphaerales bacterium]|nr:sulfatase-like hydrolase/transferase [Sedimentisphaerales bacterium]
MDNYTNSRRDFLKTSGLYASALALTGCRSGSRIAPTETSVQKPNMLWITCEDTSPLLGCYGDELAITPHLDKLAGEGIRYTKAFATAPVCAPSRSCLITGVYATSLGTQHLRSEVKLPEKIKCFPEYLREAGYYCSNNYKKDYNFIDFGVWDESSQEAHWRNRRPGQPFLSVFNFVSTHQGQINGSDEEFEEKYGSKLEPVERHDPAEISLPPYYPDTPFVRKIWARYYDLITFMDKQVGEILNQLEADGLADNTIVFFYADHGLGIPRFKRTLYDSGLHVPLIVRFPERYQHLLPARPGETIDNLVSFVDFAPTVLNLAGLPIPGYMQGRAFLGSQAKPPRKYLFGASSRVDEAYEFSRCVRDKRYKYIRNFFPHLSYIQPSQFCDQAEIMQELRRAVAEEELTPAQKLLWASTKPAEELYDTIADPHEINNLVGLPETKAVLEKLRKTLRAWMLQTRDTGLLPEAEMHIRAEGSTPYTMTRNASKYPQRRILAAADLVGKGPQNIPGLIRLLGDSDSVVRYWAVIALDALGPKARPATEAIEVVLEDASPNVRFAAAGVLCRMGSCDSALHVLANGLKEEREETVLYAAREIQRIGAAASPIVEQVREAKAACENPDGGFKNNNHAMFIDWALKNALESCSQESDQP